MFAKEFNHFGTSFVILRQYLQKFDHGHYSPAIGTCPVKLWVLVHAPDPAMHKETLLLVEHAIGKLNNLFDRIVIIFLFSGKLAHLGQCRYPHKKIIQPERIGLRTISCKGPILETELLMGDVVQVTLNHWFEISIETLTLQFDHGGTKGTAIIQCLRMKGTVHHVPKLGLPLFQFQKGGPDHR